MKKSPSAISRRSFINKSAAASFGFAVMPAYLALGKDSQGNKAPSQRVNLACVGLALSMVASLVPARLKDRPAESAPPPDTAITGKLD